MFPAIFIMPEASPSWAEDPWDGASGTESRQRGRGGIFCIETIQKRYIVNH